MKSERQSALSPRTAPEFVEGCPFCTIDPKRTTIVGQYKYNLAILSNPRLAPGHLLLIPIKHVEMLSQLEEPELRELISLIIVYQNKIICRLTPGCDLRQNYHPFEPQGEVKVDHLHFHLIPRSFNDKLYTDAQMHEERLFQMVSEEEKKKFAEFYTGSSSECE
jgi:diadenosine tetraphosphate (Ap4A) HIT family hydrolase